MREFEGANDLIHTTSSDGTIHATKAPRYGQAGEHLVMAQLLTWGYPAYLIAGTSTFDILVPFNDLFCRIQVKALIRPNASGAWQFQTFQGKWTHGRRPYQAGAFDIIAYAALGLRKCFFSYGVPATTTVYVKATCFDHEEESWLRSWRQWQWLSG